MFELANIHFGRLCLSLGLVCATFLADLSGRVPVMFVRGDEVLLEQLGHLGGECVDVSLCIWCEVSLMSMIPLHLWICMYESYLLYEKKSSVTFSWDGFHEPNWVAYCDQFIIKNWTENWIDSTFEWEYFHCCIVCDICMQSKAAANHVAIFPETQTQLHQWCFSSLTEALKQQWVIFWQSYSLNPTGLILFFQSFRRMYSGREWQ